MTRKKKPNEASPLLEALLASLILAQKRLPASSPASSALRALLSSNDDEKNAQRGKVSEQNALSAAAEMLLTSSTKESIVLASCLRKVILHVLVRAVEVMNDASDARFTSDAEMRERGVCALISVAKLLPHCRQLISERVLAREKHPLFWRVAEEAARTMNTSGANSSKKKKKSKNENTELFAHLRMVLRSSMDIAECFGCKRGAISGTSWDWSQCGVFLTHEDARVRWIACGIVCEALGLSDDAMHAARKKTLSDEDESTMAQFQREWEERETAFRIERASFLLPKVCEKEQNEDGSNIEVEKIYTLECAELEDGYEREHEESIPAAPGYERLGAIEVRAKRNDDDNNGVNDINASTSAKMNNNNKKKDSSNASDFVLVPSAERNLVAVAYALCQNRPVLLEGPAGCGKSATLREAARRFGRSSEDNDVIVLHFDAHTDSKSLLGAYVCGASPGEFEWQPGSLTRAVKTGKWVLIEDVDVAPFEVLSALIPLLEERKLYIAGRGETVVAHPQFQLFGSATVGGSKVSNRENDPLSGLWTRVSVEQPSGDEPGKILAELYPQFGEADIKGRMLKTMRVAQTMVGQGGGHPMRLTGLGDERFDNKNADDNDDDNEMMIDAEKIHPDDANEIDLAVEDARKMTSLEDLASSEAASSSRASVGRPFTLRDLLRWAKRATALRKTELKLMKKGKAPPPQTRQAMYDEAADVLLGALPPGIGRRKALQAVAEIWGLNPEETANTTDLFRKPDVMSSEDSVRVGRTMLPCEENENTVDGFRNFAKTGHALRMLERVSCAVSVNEPALLVGETGTGKTALVQELARLTGAPLTVVNLSNQSESSDFLGGFRPAGARHLCLPLLKRFLELFGETFPSRSNAEFLGRVSKFADKRKWIHLLKAFRAGVDRVASVVDKDDEDKMVDSSEHGEDPPSNDNDMEEATPAVVAAPPTTRATRSQATGKKGKDEKVSTSSVAAETSNKRQKTSAATKKKTGSATKKEAAKKSTLTISDDLVESWQSFDRDLVVAERAIGDVASSSGGGPIFAFVEGALVTALREGHWILLDEINLAPAETLERLNGVLESRKGSIVLSERGDATPVYRHPRFRLFAAMNPATDVGKRDLPPALKHRFAEVYCGETESREDLQLLVRGYLRDVPSGVIAPIVDFYVEAKRAAHTILLDSADQKPRYSLRTLARALEYVSAASPLYGVQRAMMDGFSMSFLTLLKKEGQEILEKLMHKHLLGGKPIKGIMKPPPAPENETHVLIEQFWVEAGELERVDPEGYVVTETVKSHLSNLARAVLLRRHPILLQGPTSAGKTSIIEYLAKRTGHRFMRINNHEHTDLQEYLGTYITDETGALTFQEGALVQAVRRGYWVVLDELNLAPSDVLEALNRLLDDNRELFVPELQETIRPHPHFVLFATQNPPGAVYGGRKVLSKAFRNRFVELHIGDIPDEELKVILNKRCEIAPSYCVKLVESMRALQGLRRGSRAFAGKDGYITARDLFRWANRKSIGYENLASDGFRVLGERLRSENERMSLKKVLEKALKVPEISIEQLYEAASSENLEGRLELALTAENCAIPDDEIHMARSIAWTPAMRRLYALVEACVEHKEPALLVGETGCGKTTVVQILAMIHGQKLRVLNCHQHTETGDFIGGFRPSRQGDAPFAWEDGPLIKAMRDGDILLVDELSLAEDSVLERLNSVLEPGRTITLPEKGGVDVEELVAHPNFRLIGTMNPGGDFGKKELSPALRNRFTEIWVGSVSSAKEMEDIVSRRLVHSQNMDDIHTYDHAKELALFWEFYQSIAGAGQAKACLQTRDILAWAQFINEVENRKGTNAMLGFAAFAHGAYLTLLDGLGLGLGMPEETAKALNRKCVEYLRARIPDTENRILNEQILKTASYAHDPNAENEKEDLLNCCAVDDGARFGISSFTISCGTHPIPTTTEFALTAPSTRRNVARLLRALQLARKPILLEGSPGVGKTSIVSALAKAAGHKLVRLNLSEQTDMMDLLGADLPASGGEAGEFKWSDGAFLAALKNGDWVLLDELNLAPQPVLEGLNAALDHRAEVFVPELGKTFKCPSTFRVFAAQNPAAQGGGRKGLPKSFLNRFTRVFVEPMRINDVEHIAKSLHPNVIESVIEKMVHCNAELAHLSSTTDTTGYRFARAGAPWEFNLRDIMRWCELVTSIVPENEMDEDSYVRVCASVFNALYTQRLRTLNDRNIARHAFARAFGIHVNEIPTASHMKMRKDGNLEIGNAVLRRHTSSTSKSTADAGSACIDEEESLAILRGNLDSLEAASFCIDRGWMTIVVGQSASGKTTVVKTLARLAGKDLQRIALTSATDTSELLGSFEQKESSRDRVDFESRVFSLLQGLCESSAFGDVSSTTRAWKLWESYRAATQALDSMSENDAESAVDILREVIVALGAAATTNATSLSNDVQSEISSLLENFDAIVTPTSFNVGPKKDAGRFEWVDGALLKAVERGDWVLLENANLCSPTVLDRLNPLLEPEGTLLVNECGFLPNGESRIVKAHEDFRLFLAVDPKRGEVSRAMRNRGVEVFLHPKRYESPSHNEQASLFSKQAGIAEMPSVSPSINEDIKSMVLAKGIPNGALSDAIVQTHFALIIKLKMAGGNHSHITSRDSCRWAELALALVNRGVPVMRAFRLSLPHSYNVPSEESNFVYDKTFVPQMLAVHIPGNSVQSFMSSPIGWPNRVATANRISREDRLALTSLEQFSGFSLSTHTAALLASQSFIQKMRRGTSMDEEEISKMLHENQSLVANLPISQLMKYFEGEAIETSLEEDDATWSSKVIALFRASTIYALKKSASIASLDRSRMSWSSSANAINSACNVPQIESSVLAWTIFQRFFENKEPLAETVQLLAPLCARYSYEKAYSDTSFLSLKANVGDMKALAMSSYRAKNAKEKARQSAVHASLDKIALANQLLEETNEILLQESLSCIEPLNGESMKLLSSFVSWKSRFDVLVRSTPFEDFELSSGNLDSALENLAVTWLKTKQAAHEYEIWLSVQNKKNTNGDDDRVGLRDEKRSLLVDEAFGVPSKPPGVPLLWQAIGKPTLPQSDALRDAEDIVRVASSALKNNGSRENMLLDQNYSSRNDPSSRAIAFLAKEAANLGASAKLRFAALEALCFFSFTHAGIASIENGGSHNDAVVLPSLLSRQLYQHCVDSGAWDASVQERAKSMLKIYDSLSSSRSFEEGNADAMMVLDNENDTGDLALKNIVNEPFAFEIPNRDLVKSLDDNESWSLETSSAVLTPPRFSFPPWTLKWKDVALKNAQLSPFAELRSLELDREVLALLALILSFDSSVEEEKDYSRREKLFEQLHEATSKALSFGVSHSPRAASDFEGHRKLLWDMSDPTQTTVEASVVSRRALEIFLSWHDAHRSGALSQLPHFLKTTKKSSMNIGLKNEQILAELEKKWLSCDGPARTERALQTILTSALFFSSVGLEERGQRVAQLRLAARQLRMRRNSAEDESEKDWDTLRGVFIHTMRAYGADGIICEYALGLREKLVSKNNIAAGNVTRQSLLDEQRDIVSTNLTQQFKYCSTAVNTTLIGLFECLSRHYISTIGSHQRANRDRFLRGMAWARLGCLRLHCMFPPGMSDPMAETSNDAKRVDQEIRLENIPAIEITEFHERSPLLAMGSGADPEKQRMVQAKAELEAHQLKLQKMFAPRPSVPKWRQLMRHIHRFSHEKGGLAEPERLEATLQSLEGSLKVSSQDTFPEAGAFEKAYQEAKVLSDAAKHWSEALETPQFAGYADATKPLRLAAAELTRGLSLLEDGLSGGMVDASRALATRAMRELFKFSFSDERDGNALERDTKNMARSSSSLLTDASTLKSLQKLEKSGELRVAVLKVAMQKVRDDVIKEKSLSPQLWKNASSVFDRLADLWKSVRDIEMEKDDSIYEHDDKIAVFRRVTAAPTAVEIMEGDDEETEKRFSETTFGTFNEEWKEFKDAPGDILQLDHDCVEEGDEKKKSEEDDSDDEMDNNAAIAAKTAGLLEGALLLELVATHDIVCAIGASTSISANVETSYDTERHAVNPSKFLHTNAKELTESLANRATSFVDAHDVGCMILRRAAITDDRMQALPRVLDDTSQLGNLTRVCLEHLAVSRGTMSEDAPKGIDQSKDEKFNHKKLQRHADTIDHEMSRGDAPGETSLALPVVANCRRKITALLQEWPEHPLLTQLAEICDRILKLPLLGPVKTFLTGLELLLARAQTWEQSASTETSLLNELTAMANVAMRWRRRELHAWSRLLERCSERHAARARRTWFALHRLLKSVQSSSSFDTVDNERDIAAMHENDEDEDEGDIQGIREITRALEEYLQGSTLGEFLARLSLVKTFEHHLTADIRARAALNLPPRRGDAALRCVLHNTYRYYHQFKPVVETEIENERATPARKLEDHAKLAKWENRGYHFMKQQAESNERVLHKHVRQFDRALQKLVLPILESASRNGTGLAVLPKEQSKDDEEATAAPTDEDPLEVVFEEIEDEDEEKKKKRFDKAVKAATMKREREKRQEIAQRKLEQLDADLMVKKRVFDTTTSKLLARVSRLESIKSEESNASSLLHRVDALTKKITSVLATSTMETSRRSQLRAGSIDIDAFASRIARRATALRTDETVKKAIKKKALNDLMKTLPELGITHKRAAVPEKFREPARWFTEPPLEPLSAGQRERFLTEEGEEFDSADQSYYVAMSRVQRLQNVTNNNPPNPDLEVSQTTRAVAMCEHLLHRLRAQRKTLSSALASENILDEFATSLEKMVDEAEEQNGVKKEDTLSLNCSSSGGNLAEWMCNVRAFIEDVSDAAKDAILASIASSSCESIPKLRGAWGEKTAREALQNVELRCEEAREALNPYVKLSFSAAVQARPQPTSEWHNPTSGKEMFASWRAVPMLGLRAKRALSVALDRLNAASKDIEIAYDVVAESARSKDVVETYGTYASDCENCPGWDPLRNLLGARLSSAISQFEKSENENNKNIKVAETRSTEIVGLDSFNASLEMCIERALIWAQGVHKAAMTDEEEEKEEKTTEAIANDGKNDEENDGEEDGLASFKVYEKHCGNAVGAKRLETLCEAIREASLAYTRITESITSSASSEASRANAIVNAAKLAPMFRSIALTAKETIVEYSKYHRASTKLAKVLTAVFCGLCEEGFCGAKDDGDGKGTGDGENMKLSDDKDGTGAAEGEGKKDVSEQIDNEDQILGMEDAEKQDEEKKEQTKQGGEEEEEDRGIEMKSDFEGVTHDVENEPEDGNEDEDLEKEMGDHEDGNDIIDERLWNEEDDKKEKEEGKDDGPDEFEKGDAMKREDARDEEMRGKDEDEEGKEDGKEDGKKPQRKSEGDKEKDEAEADKEDKNKSPDEEAEDTKDDNKLNDEEVKDATGITPKGEEDDDEDDGANDDLDIDLGDNDMELDGGDEEKEENDEEEEEDGSKPMDDMNDDGDLTGENGENKDDRDDQNDADMNPDDDARENEKEAGEDDMDVDNGEEEEEDGQIDQDGKDDAVNDANAQEAHDEEDKDARNQAGPKGAGDGGGGDDCEIDESEQQQQHGQGGEQGAASARGTAGDGSARTQPNRNVGQDEPETDDDPNLTKEQREANKEAPMRSTAGFQNPNEDEDDAGDGDGDGEAAGKGAAVPTSAQPMDDDAEQNNANQNEENKSKKSGGPEMNPHRSLAAAMKKWRENLSIVGDDENEEDENAKNTGGGEDDDRNENDAAAEFEFMHGGEENEEKGPAALAPATEEQAVTQKLKGANTGEEGEEEQLNDDEKEINTEEFFKNEDEKKKKIDQADLDARNKEDPMEKEEEDVAGEMAEKQQQKKGNKKKNHRDKNFAPDDELQREDNVDANGGEVKDDDQNDDSENMASDDETDEAALLRKKKELEEKRLLEEAIVELKNANIEHEDDEEERATTTRELTEEEIEIARAEAEKDLQMFREDKDNAISEMDEDAAQHLWRTLEDLTGALSGELSEQLRLILEPTLASRLRGDYRTGKRLNMRKIIPYIASDFRKDKIWLRRSKPSERRYQVVLAVDDSLSMSENKRDRAALEAMVLLARAMSRLEVGDIGVVGFGGCVKTLHPLGEPFADQNGPKLVSKLTFRQDSTLADRPMVTLLESLHQQLSLARENSSSRGSADAGSNLQQLVLIIADGQFHEKEALSKVMREFGNQKGVLIAFIVLDNPDKSLLDMQSVSFEKGKPKMTKYLDSFPFPYYVVVQESNQLPSTISDLLRQWIEMVSNNSD